MNSRSQRHSVGLGLVVALTVAMSVAEGQKPAPRPDVSEADFIRERERLGGLSHASGSRPEWGSPLREIALADAQPIIRVGLSPSSVTATGAVTAEYDTAAAHNHAAIEIGGTGNYVLIDAQRGTAVPLSASQSLRFTALGGGISVEIGRTSLGVAPGPLRVESQSPDAFVVVTSMRRVNRFSPTGAMGTPTYRGALEIRVSETDPSRLRCINELPIEEYVAGVVVNESLGSFHVEALKAQAVAARGYALANRGRFASRGFDIDDSTLSQVYRGQTSETASALSATLGTSALVATRDGRIISALYSSSMGGHTENNEYVFPASGAYPGTNVDASLRGIHDSSGPQLYDLSDEASVNEFYRRIDRDAAEVNPVNGEPLTSLHRWTRTRTADELLARLRDPSRSWGVPASARNIREMRTTIRGASGRAMQVVVSGDGWQTTISGWSDIRALATIAGQTPGGTTTQSAPNSPSTFEITRGVDGAISSVTFVGGGFGHNVGMSQYGSQGRALRGQSFVEILGAYYSGIEIAPAFSGAELLKAQGTLRKP